MLSDTFLMPLGGVTDVFGNLVSAFLFLAGALIYFALIRQIRTRPSTSPIETIRPFGLPEAILATALSFFLLLGVLASFSNPTPEFGKFGNRVLIENLLFTLGIVLVIAAFLRLRGFDLNFLAGFSRTSFLRALSMGTEK